MVPLPNGGEICDHHRSGLPILPLFTEFYQVVSNSILHGMNVLIHCRAASHRAGTCTASYGMMAYDLTPCVAVKLVSERRLVTQVTGSNFMLLKAV